MIQIAIPASATNGTGVLLSPDNGTASGDGAVFRARDSIAVMEAEFLADDTYDVSGSTFYFGFTGATTPATLENAATPSAMVVIDSRENFFEGMSGNGAAVTKGATGVTCVENVLHHLRVELHAASTPRGVAAGNIPIMLVFIDGALVLSKTTNLPTAAAILKPAFGVQDTFAGTGSAMSVYTGPVHFAVNYMAASQTPNAI